MAIERMSLDGSDYAHTQ